MCVAVSYSVYGYVLATRVSSSFHNSFIPCGGITSTFLLTILLIFALLLWRLLLLHYLPPDQTSRLYRNATSIEGFDDNFIGCSTDEFLSAILLTDSYLKTLSGCALSGNVLKLPLLV